MLSLNDKLLTPVENRPRWGTADGGCVKECAESHVGLGFTFMPSTMAAVSGVRPTESGLASGMVNTAFQVGGALGIAALATLASSRIADAAAQGITGPAALADGFGAAFTAGAALAPTGALVAATVLRGPAPTATPKAPAAPARMAAVPAPAPPAETGELAPLG